MTDYSRWLERQSPILSVSSELHGRGYADMIFCVCQLVEKAIEHKVLLLFVDLCRAYDSMPRAALWGT